jgi:putative tryptophan/tyrosine transport system substrate-binding protein
LLLPLDNTDVLSASAADFYLVGCILHREQPATKKEKPIMTSHKRPPYPRFSMLLVVLALAAGCSDKPKNPPQTTSSVAPEVAARATAPAKHFPAPNFRPVPIIYLVNSYDPGSFGWTRDVIRGIVLGLANGGMNQGTDYQMVSETMDALTHTTTEQMQAQAERILGDIQARKPDLVLTTDDDAFARVGLALNDIPVVFNGVNGDPHRYLSSAKIDSIEKPGHNLTGVYQTTYYRQSLMLIKKLAPSVKTFATITDRSTTGKTLLKSLKAVDSASLPLQWKDSLESDQFIQWKEKIEAWQNQVDVVFLLCANTVLDQQGNRMTMKQVIEWTAANSALPDTACWTEQVQNGILVSATDDGAQQGRFSAALALKILQGADPGELPITTPPNGVPALNLKRAKSLDISPPQDLMSLLIENGVIFK